ncbi:MAG: hypothetical protein J5985_09535 [Kiritimatiellae bacterium]|nr:hypothetical protein [Kiritimatiellia bacterium]
MENAAAVRRFCTILFFLLACGCQPSGEETLPCSIFIPLDGPADESEMYWDFLTTRWHYIPFAAECEYPVTIFFSERVASGTAAHFVGMLRSEGVKEIAVIFGRDNKHGGSDENNAAGKSGIDICRTADPDIREDAGVTEVERQSISLGRVCHSERWAGHFVYLGHSSLSPSRFLPAISGKLQVELLEPETCILATGRSLALKKGRYQWYLRIEDNPEAARRGVETLTVAEAREFVRDLQAKAREIRCRHEILVKDSWTGRNRFRISPKGKELFEFDIRRGK